MKRLYTLMLTTIVLAASTAVALPTDKRITAKMRTASPTMLRQAITKHSVASQQQKALTFAKMTARNSSFDFQSSKSAAISKNLKANVATNTRAKAPRKAPQTLSDYSGEYTWSNTFLLNSGAARTTLNITITDETTGAATISGLPQNYTLNATFDLTAGTLTIPNMQNLGADSNGDINYFYIKGLDDEMNIIDGASDATATVGTISGGTITFPELDIWAIGDPEKEDAGWWYLCFQNALILNEPEDPNKDPNEGWTSLGNATFQDGWVLTLAGIDQTDEANWYEVELQQNDENPNIYRLVDPYHGNCPVAQINQSSKIGYIEFDVTDPDHVVFNTKVAAGFTNSTAGVTEMYCYNVTSYMIAKYGLPLANVVAVLEEENHQFSTFKDGVLTIPSWSTEEGIMNEACFSTTTAPNAYGWTDSNGVSPNMEAKIIFPTDTPTPPVEEETWTEIGTGTWVDGFFTDSAFQLIDEKNNRWEVTIEESSVTPRRYRILPYTEGTPLATSLEVADTQNYAIINANDSTKVYMEGTWTPFDEFAFEHTVPENEWPVEEGEKAPYGTLGKDGIITFPAQSFAENYEGAYYPANSDGLFTIGLPGSIVKNYTLLVSAELCSDNDSHAINIDYVGSDVAAIKARTVAGHLESEDIDETFAAEAASVDLTAKTLTVEGTAQGLNTTVLIACDAEGTMQKTALVYYFNQSKTAEEWVPVEGKIAQFNETIMSYWAGTQADEMTCAIEQSTATPGRYRLVEPYAGSSEAVNHDNHTHYLYINASDPTRVYLEPSALGVDLPGYGEAWVWSAAGYLMHYDTSAELIATYFPEFFGTMTENVITIPEEALMIAFNQLFKGALSSAEVAFEVKIIDDPETSIRDVNAAAETADVYYNLRGQRIAKPTTPGLYIRNNAKILIR